ncbi:methyl-accepting chemotaxis protein [Virgibacillus sp. 179-BFC.A HS]|uniref:Methyl-accepting chemotaxis protein n=1 Tax=Tigheibacillus jepli TaxID=3035914 RepID=A0ABU5CIB6_9BACI|nr:methyl-accepting chemotaxis protein [Virgibacillus sp. 179-BFC.A HS]MDY0406074.1 methyl-accepting chemotaxis protein [Virgibacillus sp. 179-BFC.A HS]
MRKIRGFKNNIPIGRKYGIVFIIIILLFAGSAGVISYLLQQTGNKVETLNEKSNLSKNLSEIGSLERAKGFQIVSFYQTGKEIHSEEYDKNNKAFNQLKSTIEKQLHSKKNKEAFEVIASYNLEMDAMMDDYIKPAVASGDDSADIYISNVNDLLSATTAGLEELTKEIKKDEEQAIQAVHQQHRSTVTIQLFALILSIILGGTLLYFVSRGISKKLHNVIDISYKIAKGDLSVDTIDYEGKDEIGKLAYSVNAMLAHLRAVISQITAVSQTLTVQSAGLNQSAAEVKEGSEQIAVAMHELASGAEGQANHAQELSMQMNAFSKQVQTSSEHGALIEQASNEVLAMSKEGSELMIDSAKQMDTIDRIVKDAVEKVRGLDVQTQKISQLVHVIKEIADQTNLLALNAAIEAARAGEHGRGFAVVADEVRKLAEQVSVSVTDITKIVSSIQSESATVTASLDSGYEEVTKGASKIRTTRDTFSGIDIFVSEMTNNIKEVSSNLVQMTASSEKMEHAIEEVAAISEETSAQVEETSASSQQSSSTMEEVVQSAGKLANLAEELNKLLQGFKIPTDSQVAPEPQQKENADNASD